MASRFNRDSPSTTDPITGLMLHGNDTRDDQNGDGDDNHLLPRSGNFGDNQGDSAFDNASFVSASAQPRNTTSYEDENRQNEGSLVTVVGDGEGNRGAVPRRQGPSHVADTVSHNVFHFDPPRIPPPQMRAASVDLSRLTTDELMVELGRRGANLREATPQLLNEGVMFRVEGHTLQCDHRDLRHQGVSRHLGTLRLHHLCNAKMRCQVDKVHLVQGTIPRVREGLRIRLPQANLLAHQPQVSRK
jgi:hypothetical protein